MRNKKKKKNLPRPRSRPLPDELIVEILLRLPVKSLIRFKCVCKSWRSLISDPHFAKSHFDLAAAPTHRLLYKPNYGSEVQSVDIDAPLNDDSAAIELLLPLPSFPHHDSSAFHNNLRILGSCGGFILLDYSKDDLFLWNPSTRDHLILWNPSTRIHKPLSYSHVEPTYEFLYGFGYDASTDDYLIVIMALYEPYLDNRESHIEFFSLKTNSWNKIEGIDFPYMDEGDECRAGSLCNGALHWLVFSADTEFPVIIAFDLIERKLSEIPLPHDLIMETGFDDFRVMGGCLSLCSMGGWGAEAMIEIWVMKEYKVHSSWTKSIVLSTHDIPNTYLSPICFTKGGGIVGSDGRGGLVKFNDKGELLEHRTPYSPCLIAALYRRSLQSAMYRESLLSLPSDFGKASEDDQL